MAVGDKGRGTSEESAPGAAVAITESGLPPLHMTRRKRSAVSVVPNRAGCS